jgi:type I restriction enzyme M protein
MRELSVLFSACLNILRDGEMLTGDKALRNLAYLLNLRLLEPQFGTTINLDLCAYVPNTYCDDVADNEHARILHFARFSNLASAPADNLPHIMKSLWDDVLSTHPVTRHVFIRGKGFDIRRQSTYKALIDLINSFDFAAVEEDVLGEAYEDVIKNVMIGKDLGQFFTPPAVKQMMVDLINPQIHPDGTIETVFDPAMGTGGFLITCLRCLVKSARTQSIQIDWDFISSVGLGGREAEPDTYQLAVSNMLIASGHMFNVLEKGDSIRSPITNTYDIVLANPPFGISGLLYDDITHPLRDAYLPICTNSAVPLFVQAIIHMLNIGGRCAIVLPDGQDIYSANKTLIAVREYLVKTCDLREVIYLPAKTFTHTSIKTCVLYFYKRVAPQTVITTAIKYAAAQGVQKETGRAYAFAQQHQTIRTEFYNFNTITNKKMHLGTVGIAEMAEHNYSLKYEVYSIVAADPPIGEVVMRALGDICRVLPNSRRAASYGQDTGIYPFYTSSAICAKRCDECDYDYNPGDECLIIGTGGTANIKCGRQFSCSSDNVVLKPAADTVAKYIYYYLLLNIGALQRHFAGIGLQHITKAQILTVNVPIPHIDKQRIVVDYLDFVYERHINTCRASIAELRKLTEYCVNAHTHTHNMANGVIITHLRALCIEIVAGKFNSSDCMHTGQYPFYTGHAVNPAGYSDRFCFDYPQYLIIIKDGGAGDRIYGDRIGLGKVFKVGGKSAATPHQYAIVPTDVVSVGYLYHYMTVAKNKIMDLAQYFTSLGGIRKADLLEFPIPVPPADVQKRIVEYCDANDASIACIEQDVLRHNAMAQSAMRAILQ